jgi:hypothetical protein
VHQGIKVLEPDEIRELINLLVESENITQYMAPEVENALLNITAKMHMGRIDDESCPCCGCHPNAKDGDDVNTPR